MKPRRWSCSAPGVCRTRPGGGWAHSSPVSLGADVLLYGWPSRSAEGKLHVGYHSGLSPAEVLVPMIVA